MRTLLLMSYLIDVAYPPISWFQANESHRHLARIHKVGDSGGLLQNFSLPPRHQTEYRSGGGILLF